MVVAVVIFLGFQLVLLGHCLFVVTESDVNLVMACWLYVVTLCRGFRLFHLVASMVVWVCSIHEIVFDLVFGIAFGVLTLT